MEPLAGRGSPRHTLRIDCKRHLGYGDTRQCGKALFSARAHRATQDIRVDLVCVARRFDEHTDGWWHDHGTNVWVSAAAIDFTVAFAQYGLQIVQLIPDF